MTERSWTILLNGEARGTFTSESAVRGGLAFLYRTDPELVDQLIVRQHEGGRLVSTSVARRVLDPRNVRLDEGLENQGEEVIDEALWPGERLWARLAEIDGRLGD